MLPVVGSAKRWGWENTELLGVINVGIFGETLEFHAN